MAPIAAVVDQTYGYGREARRLVQGSEVEDTLDETDVCLVRLESASF